MIAADSSVAIAAFATWHEHHDRALDVLEREPLLPFHAAVETYSVLTRLPRGRVPPAPVLEFLQRRFVQPWLSLDGDEGAALLAELGSLGVSGGATYDALVAAPARAAGATLVSCDRRAAPIYDKLGVAYDLLG